MLSLKVRSDFQGIQKQIDALSFDVQNRVIPAMLNRTVAKAKTEMVRAITGEFNLRSDEVRSRLRIVNARRNVTEWFAVLDPFASKRRKGFTINLIRFVENRVSLAEGRRRAKAGVRDQVFFQIKRTGGKTTLAGAFIATNKRTGGTAVFTRVGKERYPIEAKQTIDVPQMFNTRRIQSKVDAKIRATLPIEFQRALAAARGGFIR